MSNKFRTNLPTVLDTINKTRNIQIGVVCDIDDPYSLGRIKVSIGGPANKGGDSESTIDELPWCYPMLQKFFISTPKVGELVFVMYPDESKKHSYRLYFGPILSSPTNLEYEDGNSTALTPFEFATQGEYKPISSVPALKGVYPTNTDIAIQGRYNTDLIFKKNQILIRAGKFVEVAENQNNPYGVQFNDVNPAYIQIKNDIKITQENSVSAVNIVANKINLLTHKDGSPRFNLANQEDQLNDEELLKILQTAHPLPFGDILIQYLILLKNAFQNHVHSSNGTPPCDLTIGGQGLPVKEFQDKSKDLENRMLSKNIQIN
jgi:hypothetical protein